ncbi:MAG: fibronectin type III domain-containing protein [Pseudomonadota bacterium]
MAVRHDGPGLAALLLTFGLAHAGGSPPPASPELSADTTVATAGYFGLSWGPAGEAGGAPARFELQEAPDPAFAAPHTLYAGPDRATALSGRPDGTYYYRVRADGGAWSPVVAVEVMHHSLVRAGLFFALGAAVFVATVVLILRGDARERRRGRSS